MLSKFKQSIIKLCRYKNGDKILATVSSGIDSVVLCHLLKAAEVDFAIAHCNFKLRSEASEEDERFAEVLSESLNVQFHTISFNTQEYAAKSTTSIQMAARELRYEWFSEICEKHKYNLIATGHHANDQVETVLLNLVRGTGYKGLTGMKSRRGNIIRPLLPFSKEEIKNYADRHQLTWRDDDSNVDTKYKRNFIRHKVLPLLEELNPNFLKTFSENIERFEEIEKVMDKQQIVDGSQKIDIKLLLEHPSPVLTLYDFIGKLGYSYADTKAIIKSLSGHSGKQFFSSTHRLIKDRSNIIVTERNDQTHFEDEYELVIDQTGEYNIGPSVLNVSSISLDQVDYALAPQSAFFDEQKISFPFTIRKWKLGDRFTPLGMSGRKKISDLLTDKKMALNEKEEVLLLESNEEIAWVIGIQLSDQFKVNESTTKILKICLSSPQ